VGFCIESVNGHQFPYAPLTPFKNWTKLKMIASTVLTGVILGGKSVVQYLNKNGQPLPGVRQFRRNQFSTSADFLFLLFSKQSRRNQFSK
jgi:hypothetical protein